MLRSTDLLGLLTFVSGVLQRPLDERLSIAEGDAVLRCSRARWTSTSNEQLPADCEIGGTGMNVLAGLSAAAPDTSASAATVAQRTRIASFRIACALPGYAYRPQTPVGHATKPGDRRNPSSSGLRFDYPTRKRVSNTSPPWPVDTLKRLLHRG